MLVGLLCPRQVMAGDFEFEIPSLAGSFFQDGLVDVSLDLGMEFAEIETAALRLTGTQTLGSYQNLNFPGTFPLSAVIYASFEAPTNGTRMSIDRFLPENNGEFAFDGSFEPNCCGREPDYSPWLGGQAGFQFGAYTPILIGTTTNVVSPSVVVDSATLVIQGQPDLDSFMNLGDFDGDADVDYDDLTDPQDGWAARFGNDLRGDDFLMWQQHTNVSAPLDALTVPEPGSLVSALMALVTLGLLKRRSVTFLDTMVSAHSRPENFS